MNMTGEQRYAQRLEAQRIFDDKTAALAKSVQTDKMLRENFSSDDRVVQRRIGRQAKQVAADTYATRRMAEAAAAQEREALMLAQDEALAQEPRGGTSRRCGTRRTCSGWSSRARSSATSRRS